MGRGMNLQQSCLQRSQNNKSQRRGTTLGMFLGSDGILGVGAPEIAVTLLVGYFILGPSDLYKLTKEIGKSVQTFRTLSSEASKSFETSMDNQLEMQEIRKAQTELNNAFNFRRSINTDKEGEAFTEEPSMAKTEEGAAVAASAASSATDNVKRKKKRRRVKKKTVQPIDNEEVPAFTGDIPDLDFSEEFKNELKQQSIKNPEETNEINDEAADRLRKERLDRLENGQPSNPPDWYSASEPDIASEVLSQQKAGDVTQPSPEEATSQQSRFANQLSGDWNKQILENEDKLSPLGNVMEKIALLEQEKIATDRRLEEEFRLRAENEENFYRQQRKLLEEASAEIATSAYNFDTVEPSGDKAEVNGDVTSQKPNA